MVELECLTHFEFCVKLFASAAADVQQTGRVQLTNGASAPCHCGQGRIQTEPAGSRAGAKKVSLNWRPKAIVPDTPITAGRGILPAAVEPTSSSSYPEPLQSEPHYGVRFALKDAARASQMQELQPPDIDSLAPKGDYRHGLLPPEKFEQLTDAIVACGLGVTFDFILRVPPEAMSKDPEALAWLKGPRLK